MKYLSIIFILICGLSVFGQTSADPAAPSSYKGKVVGTRRPTTTTTPYVNTDYNFSFTPPAGSKLDDTFNTDFSFYVSYSCLAPACASPSIFSLTTITPLDATRAQADQAFHIEATLEKIARQLLASLPPETNPQILTKRYASYGARPAARIDFKFTSNGLNYSGAAITVFIEERKILLSFASIVENAAPENWIKTSEEAIGSLALLPDKQSAKTGRQSNPFAAFNTFNQISD